MRMPLARWLTLGLLLVPTRVALAYPTDFVDELVAGVPGAPVVFVCAPDGRFFVGSIFGTIHEVAANGALNPTPMLTLAVENFEEQGLLGMALDPGFPAEPYLYLLYTPPGATQSNLFHRISRFDVSGSTISAGSEVVLHATLPTGNGYHVGGGLAVGTDGRLYAAVGENGYDGAFSYPQQLGRLEGKVIRINRDGSIPNDNPFFATPGARQEIYQLGYRNPFRIAIQPATGLVWANDVGSNFFSAYDEINVGGAGANFGFPTVEGSVGSPPPGVSNPIRAIQRGTGSCIAGGAFYTGGAFPDEYDGNYFWLEHLRGQISRMVLGAGNSVVSVTEPWGATASGGWYSGAVDLRMGVDGALYYCTYDPGQLRRIRYAGAVSAPGSDPAATRLAAPSPNPFASATQIHFTLARTGHVRLEVFDPAGRRIDVLEDGVVGAGAHVSTWSGRDLEGRSVATGVYLIRLEAEGQVHHRRVAVTR